MKIRSRFPDLRLDPDVYAAIEARLAPGEKIRDLANRLLRKALELPENPPPATEPPAE